MDILLDKAFVFIGLRFLLFWFGLVVLWVVCVLLSAHGKQTIVKKLIKIVVVTGGVFVASWLTLFWLDGYFTDKRLKTFAHGQIQSLDITFEGRKMEVRDPTVIREFWSIICSARKVWAHHSGPVDKITLFLPEIGYTYSLGKDSQVTDEFWLTWMSYPGSNPDRGYIANVKHFRSPELTTWLRRNDLVSPKWKKPNNSL